MPEEEIAILKTSEAPKYRRSGGTRELSRQVGFRYVVQKSSLLNHRASVRPYKKGAAPRNDLFIYMV
jgi:hypothetical protein